VWAGKLSRYSDRLRAGRFGDRMPLEARFSAPVQNGSGAHPASCTMGTGSFPGVKSGRGVTLTPHPLLVPRSRKGRAILLLPLWAVRPVQGVNFTFFYSQNRTWKKRVGQGVTAQTRPKSSRTIYFTPLMRISSALC
jgi:hypothetical protein